MKNQPIQLLQLHKDYDMIPDMQESEYRFFVADVKNRGVQVPIEIEGTTILDGRHRWKAAKECGLKSIPVREVKLNGESSTHYMLKAAVERRHLTDHQRAMMAAMYAKQNPKPMGGDHGNQYTGGKPAHGGGVATHVPAAQSEAAALMGVTPKAVDRAARVLSANKKLAEQVKSGKVKLGFAAKQVAHRKSVARAKTITIPEGEFGVIVIDPPWPYSQVFGKSDDPQSPDKRSAGDDRRAVSPYPEMSMADLAAMRLPAATDCIIWLWTTNRFMRQAYALLDTWGFQEKTILTWIKPRIGLGDWLRNCTEHCILATRGHPVVILKNQSTALLAGQAEHSSKPAEFFQLVENLCVSEKRLEMFARKKRKGWEVHGCDIME